MLSKSARAATIVVLSQAFLGVGKLSAAPARLECGQFPGICCNESTDCDSGVFCCYYEADGTQSSCGCNQI